MCNSSFQVWSLWGCETMFLVRGKPFLQNGVPTLCFWVRETFPSNKWCSCPSIYSAAGVLWKGCCIFPKKWGRSKDCYISSKHGVTLKRSIWFNFPFCATFNIKASWASLRGMIYLWRIHCICWHNIVSLVETKLFKYDCDFKLSIQSAWRNVTMIEE